MRAVHAVYQGQIYLSQGLQPQALTADHALEAQHIAELSVREYEIFRLLAMGRSVAECAELLHVSQKTVSNNQTQIKEKLQVETMAALVHLAQRHRVIDTLEVTPNTGK